MRLRAAGVESGGAPDRVACAGDPGEAMPAATCGRRRDDTMSASFFAGKDFVRLFDGTRNFATLISSSPELYGLDEAQCDAYVALSEAFRAAYVTAAAPSTRTAATIAARNSAARELRRMAADLAKIIDGTSTVTGGQRSNLGLNVRAKASPKPPPGTPDQFRVELLCGGSVKLTWKANNPAGVGGVTYQVMRRLNGEGEFAFAGVTGEKAFVDSTIPAGTSFVQYQVRGVRPTGTGEWAQHDVAFGRTSMTATIERLDAMMNAKRAA